MVVLEIQYWSSNSEALHWFWSDPTHYNQTTGKRLMNCSLFLFQREHGSRSPPTWLWMYQSRRERLQSKFCRPPHQNDTHGTLYQGGNCIPVCPTICEQHFWLYGMLEVETCGRYPIFVRKFWVELFSLFGTDLRFSTTFHPQIDGQSEGHNLGLRELLWPLHVEHRPSI